ncbi:MAG: GntR family transcriptional regulator [Limnohabitans sp.]
MSPALKLERPQLLTDLVNERLRAAIVNGELALGQQVSEAQLAARMGVSKTPVREALVRLKADGLVEIHPQRGTFVFRLDGDQVGQLCRYRAAIETAALRESMLLAPQSLAGALDERVHAMRKAERARDQKALALLDMEFHHLLFEHCANPYLLAGYNVIRWQLVAMRHRAPITNAVSSHQVLVQAIGQGQVEQACQLLVGHVLDNEQRYTAVCSPPA